MAAVLEQIREHLTDSRAAGIPFDDAWPAAVAAALPPAAAVPLGERVEITNWEFALRATRDGWRSAFYGEPPSALARAALALLADLEEGDDHTERAAGIHRDLVAIAA